MVRTNIYLHEDQVKFLKERGLPLSEHIRRAMDEYITKLKELNVSLSRSKKESE